MLVASTDSDRSHRLRGASPCPVCRSVDSVHANGSTAVRIATHRLHDHPTDASAVGDGTLASPTLLCSSANYASPHAPTPTRSSRTRITASAFGGTKW